MTEPDWARDGHDARVVPSPMYTPPVRHVEGSALGGCVEAALRRGLDVLARTGGPGIPVSPGAGAAGWGRRQAADVNIDAGLTRNDYADTELDLGLEELAPDGYDAAFNHLGEDSVKGSLRLLRRSGTLVSYGSATTKDRSGASSRLPVLRIVARLLIWNALPNGRQAHFQRLGRPQAPGGVLSQGPERPPAVLELLDAGVFAGRVAAPAA